MFGIPGLLYLPQYISPPDHDQLIETIAAQPWRGALARRTQHYGYVYDYRARSIDPAAFLGELPPWLRSLAEQLHADGLTGQVPDQAIVNEYTPGQGITSHVDCIPCFDEVIISLSLAASVVMDLKCQGRHVPLLLDPRSLLVLRGEARYAWTHGIARRQHDTIDGRVIPRARRVSVTFRNVKLTQAIG